MTREELNEQIVEAKRRRAEMPKWMQDLCYFAAAIPPQSWIDEKERARKQDLQK